MRDQTIIQEFQRMATRIGQMDQQLMSMTNVLKEIVGKELLRGQALHKVLIDKKLFTDEELKTALETMMAEAKVELEKEAAAVNEQKQKAVEIIVPNSVKAESNLDQTPTPAVVPVTEKTSATD